MISSNQVLAAEHADDVSRVFGIDNRQIINVLLGETPQRRVQVVVFGHRQYGLGGNIRRNAQMRLKRGDDLLFEGEISSLRHEKDRVNEVREGFECGIGLKNFHDIEVGDMLECYVLEKEAID